MPLSRRSFLMACAAGPALCQSDKAAMSPYRFVPEWPELPAGWNFGEVSGVDVDAQGHVYVFHRGPHPIMEFDSGGRFVRSWGDGLITRAHTVRVDREGFLWIVDVGAHNILKMNAQGRVIMQLGRQNVAGTGPNNFNQPTDVAVAQNGDFYVSDGYGNSRVMKFSRNGKFLFEWGKKGSGPGEFNLPHAVVLDQAEKVYVADRSNARIQIFDANGKFLNEWAKVGGFSGLAMTKDQQIWAAGGPHVPLFNLEGQVLGKLAEPGRTPGHVEAAHGIAVGPSGEVYVAELNWRVQKFVKG